MPLIGGNFAYFTPELGYIQYLTPANPGAGNNLRIDVPANEVWRVLTVFGELTTAVTVITRAWQTQMFSDGGGVIWRVGANAADVQLASAHYAYCSSISHGDNETNRVITGAAYTNIISLPLADTYILGGGYLLIEILNLSPLDSITNVCVTLQNWRI